MTGTEMMDVLADLIRSAEERGLDTGYSRRFFDHGEWLLAFDELRLMPNRAEEQAFLAEKADDLAGLATYFGVPDPS